jgi:hypothetical protein
MSTALGIDESFDRADAETVRNGGYRFVVRYLSDDTEKNLTIAEAKDLSEASLAIVTVWEDGVDDIATGHPGGVTAATKAFEQLAACGAPGNRQRVYFAVDENVPEDKAVEYFAGIQTVRSADDIGVYASGAVAHALLTAGFVSLTWVSQSDAWPAGPEGWVPTINQIGPGHVAGVDVDFDRANTDDYGQWAVEGAAAMGPWPSVNFQQEPGEPTYNHDVWLIQVNLNKHGAELLTDGLFGAHTDAAVRTFQSAHISEVKWADGVVGKLTWPAIATD